MIEDISLLSLDDRDLWAIEHHRGGLPSQSWDYAWSLAASGINPQLAVVQAGEARMLLPFFEREWMGTTDIATTLGLSGASISSASAAPLLLWREFAIAKGWVAGYIQLSVESTLLESLPPDQLVDGNAVFLLDLRTWSLDLTSRTIRRKLRDAAKSGVVLIDDRPLLADHLKRLYPTTMRRVGARPYYQFSSETLERLSYTPSSLILGIELNGVIEAVLLFLVAGDHAESHIIGTTERGRVLAAWLYVQGIDRLRSQGVRTLNLGGGSRPGDGIYKFKEKFGVPPVTFHAVRQVYDRHQYDELCRRAGTPNATAWFPAYRENN